MDADRDTDRLLVRRIEVIFGAVPLADMTTIELALCLQFRAEWAARGRATRGGAVRPRAIRPGQLRPPAWP